MILVDTNVLIYAINIDASQHTASRSFLDAVRNKTITGALVPQIILEFYAIVTDRRRTVRPLEPLNAWEQIEALRTFLPVLGDGMNPIDALKEIAGDIKGHDIFGAYLIAQMRALNISILCTYNKKDFAQYPTVIAKTPEEILS